MFFFREEKRRGRDRLPFWMRPVFWNAAACGSSKRLVMNQQEYSMDKEKKGTEVRRGSEGGESMILLKFT